MDNVPLCFIRVVVLCACAACPCAYVCSRSNERIPVRVTRKVCSSKLKNGKDERDLVSKAVQWFRDGAVFLPCVNAEVEMRVRLLRTLTVYT